MRSQVICYDKRKCFAQETSGSGMKMCRILNASYRGEPCPFCKPIARVTNGIEYPFNPHYDPNGEVEE